MTVLRWNVNGESIDDESGANETPRIVEQPNESNSSGDAAAFDSSRQFGIDEESTISARTIVRSGAG